ncbi:MAG: hypothetical protein D3926_13310 [Desulfobacteraceae bacterium]|nr:MAG: hypothetical protein D3926_13310 [Desulfobacteraceae bacterium]
MYRIALFQQNGSGQSKIDGIKAYGRDQFSIEVFDIESGLPDIIDDSSDYLPDSIEADIVLDFLKHHDLSADLAVLCSRLKIPVIMSGKKISTGEAICPPT